MSSGDAPTKEQVAGALLTQGSVFVHLDPRRDTVRVPPWLRAQPQLVLQFGYGLAVPIRDLDVDDEGVSGTLSFNRQPFSCFVPWDAVFALVGDDGMGMVWEENLPAELAAEIEAGYRGSRSRPKLQSIDGGGGETEAADEAPSPTGHVAMDAADTDEADTDEAESGEGLGLHAAPAPEVIEEDASAPQTELSGPAPRDAGSEAEPPDTPDGRRKLPPYLRVIK